MKTTLSVIKADVGSIGGHVCPSARLLDAVRAVVRERAAGLLQDWFISTTGDDVAILMTHARGPGATEVHRLAWDAFLAGTAAARAEGLYGAGQDLLKESFAGNVTGAGPAVAELEFEERAAEPFLFFAADKTDPGAYNLPLYLAFADPMNTPGLLLAPALTKGFRWVVMDVDHVEGDRVIELSTPEELYPLAALLRDTERFVVESVWSRATGEQAAAVSTSRLHNIAGTYVGKDDPVLLVRAQMSFPATGEILAPYQIGHVVAGGMRGSHDMPLMPATTRSGTGCGPTWPTRPWRCGARASSGRPCSPGPSSSTPASPRCSMRSTGASRSGRRSARRPERQARRGGHHPRGPPQAVRPPGPPGPAGGRAGAPEWPPRHLIPGPCPRSRSPAPLFPPCGWGRSTTRHDAVREDRP